MRETLSATNKKTPLPIDSYIDAILGSLANSAHRCTVVEAAPGAGKTTRLPYAFLNEGWCQGKVLVSEPRRIAARLAAARVASEQGSSLGREVGYQVRFDDKTEARTRLIYLTEGLLLRKLISDPTLTGVSLVVLDEAHERSADLDVLIALLQRLLRRRSDLRLVIMSATLDREAWRNYLGNAVFFECSGRSFELIESYASAHEDRSLTIQVRSAIRSLTDTAGDILVFLPGIKEIFACQSSLEELQGLEVLALHGDLSIEEQSEAIGGRGRVRRVILSTNLAESSLTIPGVRAVVDSGLGRRKVFDPWSGVGRLETAKISQARCVQRAGRAAREAPGRVIHLYTKGDFTCRPLQDPPEILREDLSAISLLLRSANLDPEELHWLSPPAHSDWDLAHALLVSLEAVDQEGRLSILGQLMAKLPLPPRLSRLVVESLRTGTLQEGCLAAALLSERDILRGKRWASQDKQQLVIASDSDIEDRMDLLRHLREEGFKRGLARDLGIDLARAKRVEKLSSSLLSLARSFSPSLPFESEKSFLSCLLAAFPDRVASRRGSSKQLVLCGGTQATLDDGSAVVDAALLLVLSADAPGGRQRAPLARLVCRLDTEWLLENAGERVSFYENLVWNTERQRVDEIHGLRYGKISLDEERSEAHPSPMSSELLLKSALQRGPAVFDPNSSLKRLFVRLELLTPHFPDLLIHLGQKGAWSPQLEESLTLVALRAAAAQHTQLEQLKNRPLAQMLVDSLPYDQIELLRREAPEEVLLEGGRRLPVHYEKGRPPWVESRLQDFFSMNKTLSLCRGKIALQLHLLAPNHRALQVTTDLEGFWSRHYPDLRKQLMRRYPKHLWPEDGRTATPPKPGRIR